MSGALSMDQVLLKKLTGVLEVNVANELFGVKELTERMGMSRAQLHRKLHALTGKSTSQFIREFRLEKAMGSQGILCNWTAENVRTKRNYDITTNSISISTIHSAKGFDYACVFLLGLDSLKAGIWTEEQIRKLVYVGITHARYQLYIPFVYQTPVMDKLLASASFS